MKRLFWRLLGIRVTKRIGYTTIRFPWWMSQSMIARAADEAVADANLEGYRPRITVGHRVVRLDLDESGTTSS